MRLATRFSPTNRLRVRTATPFRSLSSDLDPLFGALWKGAFGAPVGHAAFQPRIDVVENDDELRVSAELPGLRAEDFSVEFEGDVLSLRGDKRHEASEEKDGWYRAERSYGRFERRLRIPVEVDSDRATANFENGLLVITLPKTAAAKVREIPIEAA
jgi:HSP20 family protein